MPRIDYRHVEVFEVLRVPRGDGRAPSHGDAGDERVAQIDRSAFSLSVRRKRGGGSRGSRVEIEHAVRQTLLEDMVRGYVDQQLWGTPDQILRKVEARAAFSA